MSNEHFQVAIIGSGIIGSVLALGLIRRKVSVQVYEQAQSLREIGAGIAFTANARKCLTLLDARLDDCVTAVGTVNGDPACPNNNMQFIDGYTHDALKHGSPGDDLVEKTLYKLHAGPRGFEGCHRAHFLDQVMKLIPDGVVHLSKRLDSYELPEEDSGENKIRLVFCDGTTAEADVGTAFIGCDGIKSRVRELVYGKDNPISYPHYTHKIAYRGLVPMDQAIARLGESRARNQQMYGGPNAHVLHFPVAGQQLMNVVAFVTDPNDWPLDRNMTQPATKDDVAGAFAEWGPTVRTIIDLLSPAMDKWAVFDAFDHPAPSYAAGSVCIAGDAAHASAPHHGAGAGIGVEDALALSVLLDRVRSEIEARSAEKATAIPAALKAFSTVRHERSQWLVRSSREVCETYEWNNPSCGSDMSKGYEDVKQRSHKIWYFDIDGMLADLDEEYQKCLME
ncbi:hypothetical protein P175DRAFT_0477930 [Aspergillus ochraceoroseus IBT 24754]|uniref:FAD-binding domain-containing protein n=1 Tax=Aspergillus ochraceoroseus IBT 24754 TaxID=1392256 RepID=A0A2T5M0L3_9EURO|nr:uncharacterized protein P175DRAFT_0477930 [Aspergillus ochraceoroseus IBT 24754]PTU22074.1 hypothetical protein P175DRAFT_0477930 [Aspergillus ochraceoroseus IBT 24754]